MNAKALTRDPADLWEAYCDEVPPSRRSPQGALAFAFDKLTEARPASLRATSPTTDAAREALEPNQIGPLLARMRNFIASESKRWINCGTGKLENIEVSKAGQLVQEALAALQTPDTAREALEHARARFECLAKDFKAAGDETSWAMCSVDAGRMFRALSAPTAPRATDAVREALKPFAELALPKDHGSSQVDIWERNNHGDARIMLTSRGMQGGQAILWTKDFRAARSALSSAAVVEAGEPVAWQPGRSIEDRARDLLEIELKNDPAQPTVAALRAVAVALRGELKCIDALRAVWDDWIIANDESGIEKYEIKDVAPETIQQVQKALRGRLYAPVLPAAKTAGDKTDVDWNAEARRLSAGLIALHKAADADANALRSVAYDIALNCMDAETAEFQIDRRTTLASPSADVRAAVIEEPGINEAEAFAKLREFDRLGLVIESAVRNADAPNWATVSDLTKRTRVFMSVLGSPRKALAQAGATKSAPALQGPQNTAESDPSAMPDSAGAGTEIQSSDGGVEAKS